MEFVVAPDEPATVLYIVATEEQKCGACAVVVG